MIELTNPAGERFSVRKDAISLILSPLAYTERSRAVIVVCGLNYAVRETRPQILEKLK